jgi:hypothetical protein
MEVAGLSLPSNTITDRYCGIMRVGGGPDRRVRF